MINNFFFPDAYSGTKTDNWPQMAYMPKLFQGSFISKMEWAPSKSQFSKGNTSIVKVIVSITYAFSLWYKVEIKGFRFESGCYVQKWALCSNRRTNV